ncbi:MAG TPA: hypothetical protein DDY14_03120 [Chromatiaceae bacterium]|jgi:hypothetical protein|nr:MAG: hypothetical protein N838_00400 [Thiohalocapsa sp. PB-PSB1]QQO57352.1 MAG: hypothetical protein N838_32385 [Thiohalocapsa sp. PB-PSB1]HBG94320.1 hypothetical protein [Chromatiaceae bacterium]HCS88842.1 hypothetical protein [Chromatiaceae bacterium]
MALRLEIERLRIDAPGAWSGGADLFRGMLESALQEELQSALAAGRIDDHQILRLDMPPVTVSDVYDMRETAREIARRIVQAIRQNPE